MYTTYIYDITYDTSLSCLIQVSNTVLDSLTIIGLLYSCFGQYFCFGCEHITKYDWNTLENQKSGKFENL